MDNLYTDEQWYKMCDAGLSRPEPLHTADLSKLWVYYRPWGLMQVPSGFHQASMATLYAFYHGYPDYLTMAEAKGVKSYRAAETYADAFLMQIPGTAFRSGVSEDTVFVGNRENLDAAERQTIRNARLCITEVE